MNSNDLDLDWLLRNAVAVGNLEEVKVALGKGANVNARNSVGDTSLMYAAMFGKTDIVEFLISAGADVNAGDDEGRTALMRTINKDIVRMLLWKAADINVKDNYGMTALMHAACGSDIEIIEMLVDKGADVDAKSNNGWTAFSYADHNNRKKVIEFLTPFVTDFRELREKMKDEIKRENDPIKKLELKIKNAKLYKKVVSVRSKRKKLGDVKTVKLPPKDKGKFRTQCRITARR